MEDSETHLKTLVPQLDSPLYTSKELGIRYSGIELSHPLKLGRALRLRERFLEGLLNTVYGGENKGLDMATFSSSQGSFGGPCQVVSVVLSDEDGLRKAVSNHSYMGLPALGFDVRLTSPFKQGSHLQRPLIVVPQHFLFPLISRKGAKRAEQIASFIDGYVSSVATRLWPQKSLYFEELEEEKTPVSLYLLNKNF